MIDRLGRILNREVRPRVVVVGDLILDEFLHGTVRRVSPEAAAPVLDSARRELALGGAANVAHNLLALGCAVELVGVRGADTAGDELVAQLVAAGLSDEHVVVDPSRPTTHKTRVIAGGRQVLRIDREEARPLGSDAEAMMVTALQAAIAEPPDCVVLSDYRKGALGSKAIVAALANGAPTFVDPKGLDYARYRGAEVLTPNLSELQLAAGVELSGFDDPQLALAASTVLKETGSAALLVTCGADGMMLCVPNQAPTHLPAIGREVFDITGAGDTVIAALAMAHVSGAELVDAARFANVAASVAVSKLGTATVTRDELALRLTGSPEAAKKVQSQDELIETVADLRAHGATVVCTNGCFELLHAGHVAYLQAARARGDVLVVLLNSDSSVQTLKGPARPLVPQAERAAVLAALDCVSYVTVFDDEHPGALIERLTPSVLIKGADYTPDQIAGAAHVEANGGRVETIALVPGASTSQIIDRVLSRYGEGYGEGQGED